jgi:hypothetical protein
MADKIRAERATTLIDQAVAAFMRITGLQTTVTGREIRLAPGRRADAAVEITIDKRKLEFTAETKTTLDRVVALVGVKEQLAPHGERGLLIAPHVTAELAAVCRERLHLQFMDAAGNAFIDRPGLFVFVKGERPTVPATREGQGGTATRLRTVFALLCQPRLLNAPYREIADAAGVALGTIGWVFFDLATRGLAAGGNTAGTRRLLERRRLLEEWVTNYPIKLRPKLNAQRFHAPDVDWWKFADLTTDNANWGGEVAADRLTGYLKPARVTIYAEAEKRRDTVARLATAHRLRADPDGEIEILDKFWRFPGDAAHPDVVPPILAYADLVATLDPRNIEAAMLIRKQFIDDAPDAT